MPLVYAYECGGDPDNKTTKIRIPHGDFALMVGNKCFRFEITPDGDLLLPLINGVNGEFATYFGYPAIKLKGTKG